MVEILSKIDPTRLKSINETMSTVLKKFSVCGHKSMIEDWVQKFIEINKTDLPKEHSRYYETLINVVFVIGGECGRVLNTLECLPSPYCSWRPTLPTHEGTGSLRSLEPSGTTSLTIAPLLEPHYGAAACSSFDYIYIIGGAKGVDEIEELCSVEKYCPLENTWINLTPLPKPKLYGAAAFTNNVLYVSGGLSKDNVCNHLLMLGGNSKVWRYLSPMSYARCEHNLVAVDGILYALGGFDQQFHPLKSVEKYDPTCDVWTEIAPMQCARARGGAVALEGYIYVLGGTAYIRDSDEYSQEINYERLNTRTGMWEWCGSCPNNGWSRMRSVGVGKIIVSSTGSVGVSIYNTATGRSFPGPCLLKARRDHALQPFRLPVHTKPPI